MALLQLCTHQLLRRFRPAFPPVLNAVESHSSQQAYSTGPTPSSQEIRTAYEHCAQLVRWGITQERQQHSSRVAVCRQHGMLDSSGNAGVLLSFFVVRGLPCTATAQPTAEGTALPCAAHMSKALAFSHWLAVNKT